MPQNTLIVLLDDGLRPDSGSPEVVGVFEELLHLPDEELELGLDQPEPLDAGHPGVGRGLGGGTHDQKIVVVRENVAFLNQTREKIIS